MFLFGKKDYFKPGPDGTVPVIAFVSNSATVPVYDVPAVLGRDNGKVDVLINDATVSRKHLLIGTYEGKLTATDQGSTSGTIINGETLEPGIPYYLSEGDKIKIGKLNFVCHINKERMGKKLKLPSFMQKDTAGDTSEMDKADIAAAAADISGEAEEQEPELEPAAEVVKDAEQASEPVINLMPEPVLDEEAEGGAEGPEKTEPEDPVSELEAMGLEFGEDAAEEVAEENDAKPAVSAPEPAAAPVAEEPVPAASPAPNAAPAAEVPVPAAAPAITPAAGAGSKPASAAPVTQAETIDVMRGEHARANSPKMVYYSGHTAVETFKITATPFVIGRAKSDYTPGAAGVSRRHCFIDRTGSTYYITDLESTNGVWINGRRIKPYNRTALENGDIVGIGDRVYKYEQE